MKRRKRWREWLRREVFRWPDCPLCGHPYSYKGAHGVVQENETTGLYICAECACERQEQAEWLIEHGGGKLTAHLSRLDGTQVLHQFPYHPTTA